MSEAVVTGKMRRTRRSKNMALLVVFIGEHLLVVFVGEQLMSAKQATAVCSTGMTEKTTTQMKAKITLRIGEDENPARSGSS